MDYFKKCWLARTSDRHYCIIRNSGLVEGGKSIRHHEVLIAFTFRGFVQRSKRIRQFDFLPERLNPSRGFGL
jgi:hypothetical protein